MEVTYWGTETVRLLSRRPRRSRVIPNEKGTSFTRNHLKEKSQTLELEISSLVDPTGPPCNEWTLY